MVSIKERIPAYSMWEIFYDTIQLLEQEQSESKIRHLAEIVNSESLTNIFVYSSDECESYEQNEAMTRRYQAFTVWLLGKFFYLLSCDELVGVHKLLIDAQLRILRLISITIPHSYYNLSAEYSKILRELNAYTQNSPFEIIAFKSEQFDDLKMDFKGVSLRINSQSNCDRLKETLLVFVGKSIESKIISVWFTRDFYEDFDLLIVILKEDKIKLKFIVLEIFRDFLKNDMVLVDFFSDELKLKFCGVFKLLEEFCYEVFSPGKEINDEYFGKLQDVLLSFLENRYFDKIRLAKCIVDCPKRFNNDLIKISYGILLESNVKINIDINKEFEQFNFDTTSLIQKIYFDIHKDVFHYISDNSECNSIKIILSEFSETWKKTINFLSLKLNQKNCPNKNCCLKPTFELINELFKVLLKLRLELTIELTQKNINKIHVEFFKNSFFLNLISSINHHIINCKSDLPHVELINIISILPTLSSTENIDIYFYIIIYQYLTIFYKTNNELPVNLSGDFDKNESKMNLKFLYNKLAQCPRTKEEALEGFAYFIRILSSGLTNDIDDIKKYNLQTNCVRIAVEVCNVGIYSQLVLMCNCLIDLVNFVKNVDFIPKILQRLGRLESPIKVTMCGISSKLICVLLGNYVKITCLNSEMLQLEYFCLDCDHDSKSSVFEAIRQVKGEKELFLVSYDTRNEGNVDRKEIMKVYMEKFNTLEKSKREFIKALHCFARHIPEFNTKDNAGKWVEYVTSLDGLVLEKYPESMYNVLKACQENKNVSNETKNEILTFFMEQLFKFTKDSMKKAKQGMQEFILDTIDWLTKLKIKTITLHSIKILLYFIMMPTSKHSEIAEDYFSELARKQQTKPIFFYGKFRREICEYVVNLCAINQSLVKYTLCESLESIPSILGFSSAKHFLAKENNYLMPFFVSLIVLMPDVKRLIQEVSRVIDVDIKELLANNYGGIFLYIFLNKDEDTFKKCMRYVEQTTEMNGPVLRKRNFKTILNELLLNFCNKKDRVLHALILLAKEDTDGQNITLSHIPDYLQPRFLGVLHYFDTKLFAKKQVLLSLAKIFELMGPKRIVPFRLKIIAMLRTALSLNHGDYPELNWNVWNAFVRSCDVESLGSQLATIFVSLLPLSEGYPEKINGIFRYLIVENEELLKEHIPDLFFALDFDIKIDEDIKIVIGKYNETLENSDFKGRIKLLMRYLTHDTNEVKVCALKYLKRIIEGNHEELDRMILGYNGIDPNIVELLDVLMVGCREKDVNVKLACGECIGELGAVEPSHLPRKYTKTESFIFYMSEDAFIFNSLNELIRALQAEKNTTIMDRFALAIQEILKMYGISPDSTSPKHNLWNNLPQAHQELIFPFLSSRYTMGQALEPVNASPIFGTKLGANFQSWIYNWTVSMIMTINSDKRNLLQVCLLSLKQDHRTLMHFLPHILLHSLLEGGRTAGQKWHKEFFTVINSLNDKKGLSAEIRNTRPLRTSQSLGKSRSVTVESTKQNQNVKVLFVLLDFLDRWLREFEWQRGVSSKDDGHYKIIKSWLADFCKLQLAKCSFQCGEYSRTLMYLEDYISMNQDQFKHHFSFLSQVYAQLDEPDAVAGITALQDTEPTLEQRILALEVSGKLSDAAACYERISPPLKFYHLKGLIQCYLDLDNVNTALNFVQGAIEKQPEYKTQLFELEAEPLWRLSRWEELDDLLETPQLKDCENWGVNIGKALLKLRKGERDLFKNIINNLRLQQVEFLGATSLEEGAYQHGYSSIVNLHALNELETIEKTMYVLLVKPNDRNSVENAILKMSNDLELRLKVVQESAKIIEPILCLRRVVLNQAKQFLKDKICGVSELVDGLLGESWLLSARIARSDGAHQQSYTYLLKAEEYSPAKLFLEKAKLHWLREEYEQALIILRRGIDKLIPIVERTDDLNKRKICAEAKLLIASYNDNISNVDREMNIMHYKEALEMDKECEKSFVCLAQYYDRIFHSFADEDKDLRASDIQIHMINYFGKSMLYGTNYIYQSMPRMLSIWFDYGTRLLDVKNSGIRDERRQNLLKMTKLIDTCLDRLPAFMFLTAFSQIISRICHPQKEVYIELKSIIIKLILQYPQQSMWMMISVIKSSYAMRSKRCTEILGDSRLRNPSVLKLVTDFTKLAEKLIELCNKEIPENVGTTNIQLLLRSLPRLLARDDFSEIMIPTQKFRKLILPNPDLSNSQHNPFPNHYAHIVGIEDEVVVLNSLQRPRKITFRGSDGKRYVQMLKPKDDLRRDFRLMEFNDIVNQLLSSDPESRHRRLNIRLYSVAPLNEECGLIEWIYDLVGLRIILVNIYKQRGLYMTGRELKSACCNIKDPLAKKREVFETKLLPRHPPVLGDWFRKTFPDAQSWFTARTGYIRTTAVMSMVGYILGLGDRHGENILLDSTCGDVVHVDFNCLFNKGETFEWPERVPFRLTHNMVSAMGPLGVEGVFRKSCACTLRVLREHKETLMSIVTPFVYDPLVSWPRNTPAASSALNSERTNEQAVEHVKNIELRLKGIVKTRGRTQSIPLSVEGQSNNIIQEAMSVDNLCQMYIGWGAYL